MAWTAPTTQATGTLVTAAIWNTDLTDNLAYLKTQTDVQAFTLLDNGVEALGLTAQTGSIAATDLDLSASVGASSTGVLIMALMSVTTLDAANEAIYYYVRPTAWTGAPNHINLQADYNSGHRGGYQPTGFALIKLSIAKKIEYQTIVAGTVNYAIYINVLGYMG